MSLTELEYKHYSNDLFWSVYHMVNVSDHFEKITWTGYDDNFWWNNVSTSDQFLIKKCECGKKFKLNLKENVVEEL